MRQPGRFRAFTATSARAVNAAAAEDGAAVEEAAIDRVPWTGLARR
jgi:hypothetical protein